MRHPQYVVSVDETANAKMINEMLATTADRCADLCGVAPLASV